MNKILVTASTLSLVALLSGCNQHANPQKSILNDLTPNMNGLAETYAQNDAGIAVVNDANYRMFVDDMRRATLLDKPSMLSPYPVVQD
ncbi:MAG: hypothetical protein ACI9JK_000584 [Phycisphaerales bacterium]|jgi:hypothetical protein